MKFQLRSRRKRTPEQEREIRRAFFAPGADADEVAKRFGLSRGGLSAITGGGRAGASRSIERAYL